MKYEVQITRTLTDVAVIVVEADNEEEAMNKATELAAKGKDAAGKALEWDFEDENFEVDTCDEVSTDGP